MRTHSVIPSSGVAALLAVLLLLSTSAVGQQIRVNNFGIENGLANNSVTNIYQDHYGFLWIGTYDGLSRYDGYSFKTYRHRLNDSTSLINNRITNVAEDQENRLWIGTKKGVSIFSGSTQRFRQAWYQPHHQQYARQRIDAPANEVKADLQGNIFIGTAGHGLLLYRKKTGLITEVPYVDANNNPFYNLDIQGVRTAKDGTVWVMVQSKGLCRYDSSRHSLRLVNNYIGSCSVMEMTPAGHIWMAWGHNVYEYRPADNSCNWRGKASANGDIVLALQTQENGDIWAGTDGGGITFSTAAAQATFNPLGTPEITTKLTSKAISVLYGDRQGNQWIGTLRGGLHCVNKDKSVIAALSHDPSTGKGLSANFVSAFTEDGAGNLWIGTDGYGINVWNRQLNQFKSFTHENSALSSNLITSIRQSWDGYLWIATYGSGIDRYDPKTGRFNNYICLNPVAGNRDANAWTLYESSDSTLWAGTVTGSLYRYNRQTNHFDLFDHKLTDILSLTEDQQGTLWAGNFDALIKVDRVHKQHTYFATENPVRIIHEDRHGQLWVGTEGSGLLQFDRKALSFKAFTEAEGLANNAVLNILEDRSDHLWLSTFNGLSRMNIGTGQFKNFFQSDGLLSNQFIYNAAYATAGGQFFFGGLKGMNFFYPDSVAHSYRPLQLLITDLRIDNLPFAQSTALTDNQVLYDIRELTLPYDKAVLSIDFAAPEFSSPDQVSYAYYLEGWDKGWNYSGKLRTANYSRLHEGHYTFHIKSTNAGGVWSDVERTIRITVLPPWYRSWWAYLLYITLAVAVVAIYIRYKNKQSQLAYEVRLAHLQAERESELNQRKLDFFTNVAHEFRTPITLIINPIKDFLFKPDAGPGPGEMKMVYRNSKRLLSLVDQLLLFKKADSGVDDLRVVKVNLCHVCREVFLCFTQEARSQQLRYEFESSADVIETWVDREKVEIALFNLLSNAMKFTPRGGSIMMRLMEKDQQVELSVEDTGCGIPPETGDRLFERFYQSGQIASKTGFGIGLFLAKSFIDAHQGNICYETQVNKGTTFRISLLKGAEHFAPHQLTNHIAQKSTILEELQATDNLPLLPAELEAANVPPPRDSSMDTLITSEHTILLVDDHAEIRAYLSQLFKPNYKIIEATNGKEGLAMAKQHLPDVVISDIVMQEMTGIEFCSAIKEDPALSHIQVILLTGSSSAEVKLKGVECGADDYITKPFEKDILLARVASLLKSRNNLQKYFYNEITLRKNELTISEEFKVFLERCIETVEANIDRDDFSIKLFAKEMGMSHSNLYKRVKQVSGQSINSFIRFIRLRRAAGLLISTDCNVNEAAFQVGISDSKYFRVQFAKLFGMNPSDYKKRYHQAFQKNYTVHEKAMKIKLPEE
ncbi:two-component regulator propeller domain-containing protein [Paraflavitalea pollutisoli]|uniref:two-component regulator propeller domain-containing protein n=1 Tax=Paraflavitalea pollutisoli TaxID=3034143 RepID=UPI0023EABD64|nr:two-component regulator propeller domain-containing protein [Paraflavitalea sp. H1-2-19X]